MPGSVCNCSAVARKLPAMQRHHVLGAAVQVARAAVVAQAAPQGQHVVLRGGGQLCHRGKALQKAGVIVQHRGHLGLLQHDFGQPDAVGIARVLPGQAVAPMRAFASARLQPENACGSNGFSTYGSPSRTSDGVLAFISGIASSARPGPAGAADSAGGKGQGTQGQKAEVNSASLASSSLSRASWPVNFGNALIQPGGGLLDALDRLQPPCKIAAPLTQLRIQLGRRRLVPELDFAQCRLIDHAQAVASARTSRSENSACASLSTLPSPRYCRWLRSISSRSCAYRVINPARGGACSEKPNSALICRKDASSMDWISPCERLHLAQPFAQPRKGVAIGLFHAAA